MLICVFVLVGAARGQSVALSERALDRFGGVMSIRAEATGWFRVAAVDGRWLFITPEGHGVFSLGATHADDCARLDERNLLTKKHGGDVGRLSAFILERFAECGYNSAGYGALEPMESRVPYVASIWTEGPRSFSAGARSRNTDLFDPLVQERLRATVRKAAARHIGNPFCLGYVFIDLPVWSAIGINGRSYADFVRMLPADAPGRRAYAAYLLEHYASRPTELARNYGADDAGLAAADFSPLKVTAGSVVAADDEKFINEVAARYYEIVVGALRAVDTHHLILGDRLMALPERTPDSILITAAKYVDVISFQPMGTVKPIGAYLDHVHQLTGKPVLLADVNTMTSRPAKDLVDSTEYERSAGEHTLTYYLDAARSRACLGLHRCTIRDYQPWNLQFHRRGLLRADDMPYALLVDFTRRAHAQVFDLAYARRE
jgi:hypothetical protein